MPPEREPAEAHILPLRPVAPLPPAASNQRFSLERLSSAFARLMGAPAGPKGAASKPQIAVEPDEEPEEDDSLPVTPRMIVEGMLFVGDAEGKSLSSQKMAHYIRNVSADEVDCIVAELNSLYRRDETAYEIVGDDAGYRLQLRRDLSVVRDQFRGQQRAAKLTPAAIEVLSIVAYRQGITADEVNKLRGSQSHSIIAQLVRRQLVRVERPGDGARSPRYHTTARFNQLFAVSSPADLPRSEDLDDS